MDVLTAGECLTQHRLAGDVREDAQLDLAVVGRQESRAVRCDERRADAAAELGAHRDRLEVGVGRREAARRRDRLVDRRVEPPVRRIDQRGEREQIRVEELRQLAPLLDDGDERVVVADRAQDARVGRVAGLPLPARGELELLEEDPCELLRRAELERLPGELERLRLELLDPLLEACGDLAHPVRVDPDPRLLHVREHDGERQLDLVVEPLRAPLAEPGAQLRGQSSRGFGVPDERGGLLLGGGLGDELDAVLAGEVVELVARPARVDEVGGDAGCRRRRAAEAKRLCVVRGELRRAEGARELAEADLGDDDLVAGGDADATVAPGDARAGRRAGSRQAPRARPRARGRASVSETGAAAGSASSSVSTRLRRPRNSKRRKISFRAERSGGEETSSAGSTSSGRSRRIVARSFESRAWSACSRTALPRAGDRSSACAITSSSEPYCAISWPAVLSPIPGIPGMLSEVSPFSPMKSGTWSGRTP